MARRLPTKMWVARIGPIEEILYTRRPSHLEPIPGARIGRVTIVWEKPAKKKVRRGK